jgi:hypothetical protein
MASNIIAFFAVVPAVLALTNWLISLVVVRNEPHLMVKDFKSLAPATLPFVKAQWIFLLISIGSTFLGNFVLENQLIFHTTVPVPVMTTLTSSVIIQALSIFYVSYLAAEKSPNLIATVGLWTLVKFEVADFFRIMITTWGVMLFAVPGLILCARLALFLPIYVCEGQRVRHALKKSWSLTEGKYWRVSRYLGLPMFLGAILGFAPTLFVESVKSSGQFRPWEIPWYISSLPNICAGISTVLNLAIVGLSYKLYRRLDDAPKLPNSDD